MNVLPLSSPAQPEADAAFVEDGAQYVSNADRKDGRELIESLLARWRTRCHCLTTTPGAPELRTRHANGAAAASLGANSGRATLRRRLTH